MSAEETGAAAAAVGSPAYLQGSAPWDLSLLIDEGTAKQHRHRSVLEPRLKAVPMSEPGLPLAAIEALSTLDHAQARAVQVGIRSQRWAVLGLLITKSLFREGRASKHNVGHNQIRCQC